MPLPEQPPSQAPRPDPPPSRVRALLGMPQIPASLAAYSTLPGFRFAQADIIQNESQILSLFSHGCQTVSAVFNHVRQFQTGPTKSSIRQASTISGTGQLAHAVKNQFERIFH